MYYPAMSAYHARMRRLCGSVLVMSVLFALSPPAQAAFTGQNGRIAFERDGGIWTMNPDGSDPRQLVASGDDPSWSPDGRKVVYEKSGAIYVVNVAADGTPSGTPTNLTAGHPTGARQDPDFLPSGQIIYIERFVSKQNVYRMEADGSNPTDLTPANADFLFSPASGSSGAVYYYTNVNKDLLLLGGGNVTNTAFPVGEGYPDVSPSGSLMFTRSGVPSVPTELVIGTTAIAGGASDPNGSVGPGPAWSPDGSKIAALLDNGTKLYVMDSSGGSRVQLTGAPTANLFSVGEVDWGPVPTGAPATPPANTPPPAAPPPAAPPPAAPPAAATPGVTAKPTVKGAAKVGRTLRCRAATFTDATSVTTSWLRSGKRIKGQQKATYTPTRRDVGKRIACRSTATGTGGVTTSTSKAVVVRRR